MILWLAASRASGAPIRLLWLFFSCSQNNLNAGQLERGEFSPGAAFLTAREVPPRTILRTDQTNKQKKKTVSAGMLYKPCFLFLFFV